LKFKKLIFVFIAICTLKSTPLFSQEKGTGPKEKSFQSERKIRKALKKEAKEKRRKEKAEQKAIKKHHKRIQTKKVRKRMKSSKKTAIRNNENKRDPFFKRLFKKKKKVR
jgi:hypothetical protein